MLVVWHLQNSSLLSAVRPAILVFFLNSTSVRLEDDEVFSSDMQDTRLQLHEPNVVPIPVKFLQAVLQKFAIIESRAE